MSVGSHKDAFKAHQLVKKVMKKSPSSVLSKIAADILLDFVKNQRQVTSDSVLDQLPIEHITHDPDQLNKALQAVDGLCGKCEDSHDDSCFVNQARRVLIAAKTGVDIGSPFDGETPLEELLKKAEAVATEKGSEPEPEEQTPTEPAATDASQSGISATERAELEALREQDIFRNTLIDEVVNTISSVTQGNYATEMPIHDDEQLGKLAQTFNLMLATIKTSMAELDKLVAERTAELKQIMNTVPLGLLTIDSDNRVMPEHSHAAATILNHETIRGRNFMDLLGLTKRYETERSGMNEFLDVVRMGMLSDEDLAPLNPFPEFKLETGDSSKWLRLRYSAVKRNDQPTGDILIEINDITERKRLAAEVDARDKENLQLKVIAEDPDLFKEFLSEVITIQTQTRSDLKNLCPAADWHRLINEVFRGIHTIKGAAGSFGLSDLSQIAGKLENSLSNARSADNLDEAMINDITTDLDALDKQVEKARELAGTVLGEDLNSDGPVVKIKISEIKDLEDEIRSSRNMDAIIERLKNLRSIPAHKGLMRSVKIVPDLIKRLEKNIDFEFSGKETRIDYDTAHELNTALIHLLRNACDHGIESADERTGTGKPEQSKVTLKVEQNDSALLVSITDDGKGIDSAKILQSAINKGIIKESESAGLSEEDKLRLIFRPGFSTATAVTDVSGRGVGLDAVMAAIEEKLAGRILIETTLGKGSTFTLKIPA